MAAARSGVAFPRIMPGQRALDTDGAGRHVSDVSAPSAGRLTFLVLGPLEVIDATDRVALGGPKEQLVLAQLLARVNAAVPVDLLIEGLWGDPVPRTAEKTLHAYIARLRRALDPERVRGGVQSMLVTVGRAYCLQIVDEQLDAHCFETRARVGRDQLRRGDPTAATTLRSALALWRGDAFSGFDAEPCAAERRRLGELRLMTLEDRIEAELNSGATNAVVAELDALVSEHPFRERLRAELMLALYRAGRQCDALASYQHVRAVLVEELGIEPGTDLRHLEVAILEHDPALDLVPSPILPRDCGTAMSTPLTDIQECPVFTPDGRLVAAATSAEGERVRITIWHVASGAVHCAFVAADSVFSIAFADNETLLAAIPTQERVAIYSVDNGDEVGSLETPGFNPQRLSVEGTTRRLAIGSETHGAQVWDLRRRTHQRSFAGEDARAIAWSPDGSRVAVFCHDGFVQLLEP